MNIGVYLHGSSPFYPKETFDQYLDLAKNYDKAGVHSLWFADHLIRTPDPNMSGLFETWGLIAGLARETKNVQFGTMVTPVTFREFGVFVKQLSTIDHISSGRLILGLGTGWFEREHHMFGIPFPSLRDRFKLLEETIQCLTGLWTSDRFSYSGKHIQLNQAYVNPKPVNGKIPILIGGSGERKTFRLVARYASYSNFGGTIDTIKYKLNVLRTRCEEEYREFKEINPSINRAIILGRNEGEVEEGIDRYIHRFVEVGQSPPRRANFRDTRLVGTIDQVINQLGELRDIGVELINLTINDKKSEELMIELMEEF